MISTFVSAVITVIENVFIYLFIYLLLGTLHIVIFIFIVNKFLSAMLN